MYVYVIWVCPKMRIYLTFYRHFGRDHYAIFVAIKCAHFGETRFPAMKVTSFVAPLVPQWSIPKRSHIDGKLNWGCPCWRAESIRPSSNSSKEQGLVAKVLVFKRMLIGVPMSCWTQFVWFFVHFNPCVGVPTTPVFFWWIHFLPIKSTCYCWLHPCQLDRLLGLDNCFVGKIHSFSIYCNSTHLADQIPVLIGLCGRIPILLDISQV